MEQMSNNEDQTRTERSTFRTIFVWWFLVGNAVLAFGDLVVTELLTPLNLHQPRWLSAMAGGLIGIYSVATMYLLYKHRTEAKLVTSNTVVVFLIVYFMASVLSVLLLSVFTPFQAAALCLDFIVVNKLL